MKKLKISLLFKLIFPFLLYVFTNNLIISILLLILLINKNYKYYLVVLGIILACLLCNFIKNFYNIGIIISNDNNTCTVENLLYKAETYDCEYEVGDVIVIDDKEDLSSNNYSYNLLYKVNNSHKVFNLVIRKFIFNQINNNSNEEVKSILNKIFYEESNYEYLYSGIIFSCAFYYLLKYLYSKTRKKVLIFSLIFIYYLLFGFNIKLYLIFFIFKKDNKLLNLTLQFFFIFILNRYLLTNYVILISILYRLIYTFEFKFNPFIIISSYLFNCINILKLFVYKYLIIYNIILFLLSFICIFIDINQIILFIYDLAYKIISIEKYLTIRGKISLISLILFYFLFKIFKPNKTISCLILILLIVSPLNNPYKSITFIDVGQGDSILIQDPFTYTNVLIDTGSSYNYYKLKNYLYSKGIYKIDKLIVTHNDSDHNGNIDNLYKDFFINEIVDTYQDVSINGINLTNLYTGEYDNDNDNSLVYYTSINGLSFLFTGDISKSVENKLIDEYGPLDIDVIKLAHHGSKTSSSYYFLSNINPKLAIISTNGMYNHPSTETLETLDKLLIDYLSTKEVSSIEFKFTLFFNLIQYKNQILIF